MFFLLRWLYTQPSWWYVLLILKESVRYGLLATEPYYSSTRRSRIYKGPQAFGACLVLRSFYNLTDACDLRASHFDSNKHLVQL